MNLPKTNDDDSINAQRLAFFWDMLNAHDWYYQYSDDHRVWSAGEANWNRLNNLANTIPGGRDLLSAFVKHYFSGLGFETPKAPKPERPTDPTLADQQEEKR